jgi:YVTN family beta-propeller protein
MKIYYFTHTTSSIGAGLTIGGKMKRISVAVYLIIIFSTIILFSCTKTNKPPNAPDIPSGQTNGLINVNYNFVSSAFDPEDDPVAIKFIWGDGDTSDWSDFVASGETVSIGHSWQNADTYYIRAQAKDVYNNLSNWSNSKEIVISDNRPPQPPAFFFGPNAGAVNVYYNFSTSTSDPDNDSIAYQFDWGNGIISDWSIFFPDDSFISIMNCWSGQGIFLIKIRAKDTKGAISGWSYGHQITIILTGADFPNHIIATIPVGQNPFGVTVLPNGNYIYVVNSGTDNVSVIQTSDNTVIATVAVGNQPADVTALPNNQFVYVTNEISNSVSVIQTSDNTIVSTIPVGQNPIGISALPNGNFIFVVNSVSDNVSVIQTSNNTVVATIPVGSNPYDITSLSNSEYLYVTNIGSNNISVINTLSNSVIATILLSSTPYQITALPNSDLVYVSNPDHNCVSVIQTSNNSAIATIPVNNSPYGIAVFTNGDYVYLTNKTGKNITVIRVLDNSIVASIPVGQDPQGIVALPNNERVYVTNNISNNVSVVER